MSKKARRGKSPPFVKLDRWFINTPAWRDLDTVARSLYIELRARYNGVNNGSIGLGAREACEALHVGRSTVQRAFDSLIDHGFIEVATLSTFHQKRLSREWLLTEEKDDRNGHLATKRFAGWKSEIQNVGPSQDRIGPSQDRKFSSITVGSAHRSPGEPIEPGGVKLQAHIGTTYRSTTGRVA